MKSKSHNLTTYSQVKALFEQGQLEEFPEDPELLHIMAIIHVELKNYSKALNYVDSAIQKESHIPAFHNSKGNILMRLNDYRAATKALQAAISIDPNYPPAYNNLGTCFIRQDRLDLAINAYQTALRLKSDFTDAQYNLARCFMQKELFEDAINLLENVLAVLPQHKSGHYLLATAYLIKKNPEKALKHYLRQIEIHPTAEAYYNIGVLIMNKDRHREAVDYFKRSLSLDPNQINTYLNLASTYLKMRQFSEAIHYYEMAEKLNPNDPEIQYVLSALKQNNTLKKAPKEFVAHLFDEYAPYYDRHLTEQLHYQAPTLIQEIACQESASTDPHQKILDLGCGTGLCGEKLRSLAKTLIGIDISKSMIEIAREKNCYDTLEVISIESALKKYDSLDMITAGDVFTYIGDLEEIFSLAEKALKPKGLFIFTAEKTHQENYTLQKSVRYAHQRAYIETLANQYHFEILVCNNIVLRKDQGNPVEGYVFCLKKD